MAIVSTYVARRANRYRVPVLMYHGVCSDDADPDTCMNMAGMLVRQSTFREHMQYVANRFNAISMHEFVQACRGERDLPAYSCVITFDDGLLSVYENALPVLREFKLSAIVYVMGGSFCSQYRSWVHDLYGVLDAHTPQENALALITIGVSVVDVEPTRRVVWENARLYFACLSRDERFRQIERLREELGTTRHASLELMSATHVQELIDSGIEIGAHTLHHESLVSLNKEELENEIRENHCLMDRYVGESVRSFCYPFGGPATFNSNVICKLKEHGFESAVSTIQGLNDVPADLFQIKRMHITHDMPIETFRGTIHGVADTRRQWQERRSQLLQRWSVRSLARRFARLVGLCSSVKQA